MPSFDMEALKNISILEYAEKRGYELKRIKDDYFKLDKMGGTYITPSKNMFNSFAQKTGGGIIQFVMFTEGLNNKEAMHLLNNEYLAGNLKPLDIKINNKNQNNMIEKKEKNFILPSKNIDNNEIINYLVNYRKIDQEFVNRAIDENKIYQKANDKNLIYLVKNSNEEIMGAEWINTSQSGQYKGKKGFVAGSKINEDCPFVFKGKSNKIHLFESPTDLMSYMTLEKIKGNYENIKDDTFIANWSIANDKIIKYYLQKNKNIDEVYIYYDNDVDGTIIKNGQTIPFNHGQEKAKELVKELTEKFVKYCSVIRPTEKDYNDDLKKYVESLQISEENKKKHQDIKKENTIDELKIELESLNKQLKEKDSSHNNPDFLIKEDFTIHVQEDNIKELKAQTIDKEIKVLEKQKQEEINRIKELENELSKVRNSYTTTVNKMLELKDKQHNEIIKNSARMMLKAGISIALVNEATKINISELEKINEEIIESKINSFVTTEIPNLNAHLSNIDMDVVEEIVLQRQ